MFFRKLCWISKNIYFVDRICKSWENYIQLWTTSRCNAYVLLTCQLMNRGHEKREKGSLDWVSFVAQSEVLKILVPRLPQSASNENIECMGKSMQLYSLCNQPPGALMSLFYCLCYNNIWMFLVEKNSRRRKTFAAITRGRAIEQSNLKAKLKTNHL